MIYNAEEIRLTAEEYVNCIMFFYALKEQGNTRGYDLKITSVEEDGVDFDVDFLSFDLSSGIVEQFEMLSNMTIKSVLDKLRFIMTHAIYSLYEVQELLKQNKTAYRLCPNFTLNAYLEGNVFKNVLNYLLECHRLYNYFVDGDYFNCCIRYVHEDVKNPFHMYNNKGEDVSMTSPIIQHVAFTTNKEIAVHEVMENLHAVMFMLSKLHLDKLKLLRKTYQDALELNGGGFHTRVKYNDKEYVGLINTMYINLPKEIKSTDVEHIDTVRLVKDVVDAITVGVSCNYSCEKDKITVFDIVSAMVCHSDTLLRDTYGDGYTNYDATIKVFLDKMGCTKLNKHISQAMMLYIIYYFRYKIKNDTYLRLERLKHSLEFENGTFDNDVTCKDGHIFLNRRYHEREELIGSIINFNTLPIKSSDYNKVIPSVLVMMLDTLKVVGSTWYYHARFTTPMHMVQLMYELRYEKYDNLFCEYYTSSDTFKLMPDTYCSNSDDIHINWYHYGNTVLPTYGTYDRNTILKDTVFVDSGYLNEARMSLITLLKVVDDTLHGITKEVDSLELRYNMSDYNYNMEFNITFTDGETVVRHTEFNLADFYYLYGLLLYCEGEGFESSLFNYKMDIYSFKTTIKDMAYRINAVAKEFYTFNGDLINSDEYAILESIMSHAKGYKKSLGSSQVIEKEVEDMGTEVVDPVVEVLTKYSNEVDVKYIARVLSNEFMLSGYDYIVVKDDKMKVYSTDGSKCQVIAKPLHRFFYNADTIDKLPLLYYLID